MFTSIYIYIYGIANNISMIYNNNISICLSQQIHKEKQGSMLKQLRAARVN